MIDYSHDGQWAASLAAEKELADRIVKAIKHYRKQEQSATLLFGRICFAIREVSRDFSNEGLLDDASLEHPYWDEEDTVFDKILGITRCGDPELSRAYEHKKRLQDALTKVQHLLADK